MQSPFLFGNERVSVGFRVIISICGFSIPPGVTFQIQNTWDTDQLEKDFLNIAVNQCKTEEILVKLYMEDFDLDLSDHIKIYVLKLNPNLQ